MASQAGDSCPGDDVSGGGSAGFRKDPWYRARGICPMDGWTPGEAAEEEPDGYSDQRGCSRRPPSADGPAARGGAWTAGRGHHRRRASDAFRLGLAVVVVAVSIPVMRANSAAELSIVRAVHPPPRGNQLAGHLGLLARFGRGQRAVGRGRAAGPAVDRGPAGSGGRRADPGRVHPARRFPAAGGRAPAGQRACRAERRVSGHADRGGDRRGGHRATLFEPSGAPAGVVPGRRGCACRGLRRGSACR